MVVIFFFRSLARPWSECWEIALPPLDHEQGLLPVVGNGKRQWRFLDVHGLNINQQTYNFQTTGDGALFWSRLGQSTMLLMQIKASNLTEQLCAPISFLTSYKSSKIWSYTWLCWNAFNRERQKWKKYTLEIFLLLFAGKLLMLDRHQTSYAMRRIE